MKLRFIKEVGFAIVGLLAIIIPILIIIYLGVFIYSQLKG